MAAPEREDASRRTSQPIKTAALVVIVLLVLAILLLATGVIKMSPLTGP
jgi:hypothetical protein